MDLYSVLCKDCQRKADEWSSTKVEDRSEENWEKNYKPCYNCYSKVREEMAKQDTQNP